MKKDLTSFVSEMLNVKESFINMRSLVQDEEMAVVYDEDYERFMYKLGEMLAYAVMTNKSA